MKKLILITGIPSSGKTTLANKLAPFWDITNVQQTDHVYDAIGEHLKIKNFSDPNVWRRENQEIVRAAKEKHYKKMLSTDDCSMLEGYGLMFFDDREIIKAIYPEYEKLYFFKDVRYGDWLRQKGVLDTLERSVEYEYLRRIGSIHNKSIIIL